MNSLAALGIPVLLVIIMLTTQHLDNENVLFHLGDLK
jgi:hypothetical protein